MVLIDLETLSNIMYYSAFCMVHSNTVEPDLSGPHLSGSFTYPDTYLGTIYDYIYTCLTYTDNHLSGQSAWERRCPDK